MTTQYATSYDQTTTVTQYSTTQTTSSGVVDKQYVKSIPGILKIVEVVFGLVAFLLVISSAYYCVLSGLNGFYDFAVMLCVVTTVVLYIILVFKLQFRVFRCKCVVWPLMEMYYYIAAIVLLLLANILLSAVACTDQLKAGVAFGWFALVAYVVDLVFAIIAYRKGVVHHSESTTHHETTTTTTTTRY